MCYVYILQCSDDTLYTGWTNNLEKRLETHSKGKGAKYTRCRLPVKLVYFESHEDKISAQKREYAIKKLTREQKLKLIKKAPELIS
ncbi:GIY-YIG nuclease family protein [Clostridium polynesiense]|uniref:GIY-YIG nuclease family protein n=1 Tax=Clostridium polynesiense TaxID=1325933 RepID=UPI00058B7432|nr:GIY-YIG nuclease family protein [Clostridium polynesiense]